MRLDVGDRNLAAVLFDLAADRLHDGRQAIAAQVRRMVIENIRPARLLPFAFGEQFEHAQHIRAGSTARQLAVGEATGPTFAEQVVVLRIVRPTGEQRVLSGWGDVTRDEQGRPSRMLGVCQDVTDWRQREEQLIDAQAQAELSRRLQSGLLPSLSLPDPGLELRTRYRPGHERAGCPEVTSLPV